MGLFTHTIAGTAFIVIGSLESLTSSTQISTSTQKPDPDSETHHPSSPLTDASIAVFAFLFIVNSLISLLDAVNSHDRIGLALQLQALAIAGLFLFYSVLGLLSKVSSFIHFPSVFLNLVLLFGFVEEFLMFYMQKKDASGIENRYFDLLLVPISVCVVSTAIELKNSSGFARLGRGVGLVLQGTWFVQMGISFYSNLIVQGCFLHEKSRGNYTVKCRGHPEYHRARGIATLQFNCHLALIVIVVMAVYSIMAKKYGVRGDSLRYKPLGAETRQLENDGMFSLDSDEDEIREEENVNNVKGAVVEMSVNGNGSHT